MKLLYGKYCMRGTKCAMIAAMSVLTRDAHVGQRDVATVCKPPRCQCETLSV